MVDFLGPKSISILLAVGMSCGLTASEPLNSNFGLANNQILNHPQASTITTTGNLQTRLVERCCQIGRERAIEKSSFNCKLSAREALAASTNQVDRASSQLLTNSVIDLLLARDQTLSDRCELVLESCCMAHHRTRNCDSGKQFSKSGSVCMDVELSKEVTIATESFNDCCMACSLGILAARQPSNESSGASRPVSNDRCKLMSHLANSLSGQLYEKTYVECCEENLPRPLSALIIDSGAPIDCSQNANVCSQRCLPAGSFDQTTRKSVEQDRCDCFSGFKLASDGISCNDIDECKLNLHSCSRRSEVCDNTRGSFRCLARAHNTNQEVSTHYNHLPQQHHLSSSGLHSIVQPLARSFQLDDQAQGGESASPFSSMRLCPLGSRCVNKVNAR